MLWLSRASSAFIGLARGLKCPKGRPQRAHIRRPCQGSAPAWLRSGHGGPTGAGAPGDQGAALLQNAGPVALEGSEGRSRRQVEQAIGQGQALTAVSGKGPEAE